MVQVGSMLGGGRLGAGGVRLEAEMGRRKAEGGASWVLSTYGQTAARPKCLTTLAF